ncbi:MAG TPA: TonB-dependent vitamin B12 receptor [Pelomicrobium sp.]|nr:TonB-dependent vitamin B12 receptor [Pelomicrobium sp.]
MKKRIGAAGTALAVGCGGAMAQGVPAPEYVALAPVIVTATRTAETADETLASVSVITREDIVRQQALTVDDALRNLAGITFSRNGGLGNNTSLFLRGTEADHVLVLVDGIRVGSATVGQTAFQDIPIDQIERIEVVRGPRSSLYGADAIGGVIQIFTRRGGGELRPFASVGGGSYSTSKLSAGLSGGGETSWFNATIANLDTQGINACSPPNAFTGCFAVEPDRDAYRNRSGSLRLGHRFDNGADVDFSFLRTDAENEFDGTFVNETDTSQQVLGGRLRFSPLDAWKVSLLAGQSRDNSDNYLNGMFMSRFDTRRDTFSFQNDVALAADQVVTLGYDYLRDQVESDTQFAETSRRNDGVFGQYLGRFGRHDVQGSLRYDDNEQFGGETTGNAAWGYAFAEGYRATVAYGTAFKAPSFNDLYFPFFGNPDLEPEESKSFEVGLSGTYPAWRWQANAYETRIDNLIAFDPVTFLPQNIEKARIRGLELIASARIAGWDTSANVTFLDPINDGGGPNNGNVLPRRAEQALRVDVDRRFGQFSVGATVAAEGRRYDDLANTVRMGSYAVVDLRAEYRPHKDWTLQARVNNVFDKDYETAAYFNQLGANFMVTLRYAPGGS